MALRSAALAFARACRRAPKDDYDSATSRANAALLDAASIYGRLVSQEAAEATAAARSEALPPWVDNTPLWTTFGVLQNARECPVFEALRAARDRSGQATRTLNCLYNLFTGRLPGSGPGYKVRTLRDLLACSEGDLLLVKNFGPRCVERLRAAWASCGVEWPPGGVPIGR